jgi:meso-butanediol dehydrogenase/(S,S)-butanediol dehydrogenase/diacetyl reductase
MPARAPEAEDGARTVIITGAGAGIGRACAHRFAQAGYAVLVSDLDGDGARASCEQIREQGGIATAVVADVSDRQACLSLSEITLKKWGRIDALVANAGIQQHGSLLDSTEKDWERILGINLKGTAWCCEAVLPTMIRQGQGAIIINSSINAVRGSAGMAIYDISKAGVLALMRNLAVEHGRQGVRVNAVCPGTTITDFHINRLAPEGKTVDDIRAMFTDHALLGRAAEPHEIANAVYFLASDEASFITGQALLVDGGVSVTTGD